MQMRFSMGNLGFFKSENDVTMNRRNKFSESPYTPFEIHQISSTGKIRDSPTSSILKTPTAIFVTTRSSSAKTKRLKFANGPVDLQTMRNGSHESSVSFDSSTESSEDRKFNSNGEILFEDNVIEVAISPVKTMQVSPDSWKAFLEYKKYNDYANDTEKTDYTYSRLSKYRHKEIIPGFLVRPNLSRSSISSRRSSFSLPSSRSSFNESYHSGEYEFKVYNHPNSEISYDFKAPNQSNKFTRSKYYLRSSTLDGADTGEVDNKATYFENEYFSGSSPKEKFIKKIAYTTTEENETPTPFYTKLRAMNLDDANIDEVDDNPVNYDKHYFSMSDSSSIWPQRRSQSVTGSVSNVFTAIFLYFTSMGTVTKDLFSKYILRRKDDDCSQSSSDSWKNENLGYSTKSGGWIPWGKEKAYASGSYYSSGYYARPRNWYQKLYDYFYDSFSKVSNVLWGSNAGYATSRYNDTFSRRRRFWWFLIPLLLLAGLWLFKAEEDHRFISNQYRNLDCRINGFLTSVENTIKPAWRSGYVAYKRVAASVSCYVDDSWGRLKLPFIHISEWLSSKFSALSGTSLGYILTFWNTLWEKLRNAFILSRDALSNLCLFFFDFFTDFLSAGSSVLSHVSGYFTQLFVIIRNSSAWIFGNSLEFLTNVFHDLKSCLYSLLFAPRIAAKHEYEVPAVSKEMCSGQPKTFEKFFNDMEDFKSNIKKKIDELELEIRKEKESRTSRIGVYDRQLDELHKTLQKNRATINQALLSAKRPGHISSSSIQYLLDHQTDDLKQWIAQNNFGDSNISVTYIKKLIADAIKLYDADKTGRVDYALETAGGQIVSIRCTETYIASPKSYVLLGWAVYTKTSSPRDAISPGMAAGQCWAFVGSQGFLVIQLSHTIKVTGFTMEHISKTLVPRGHIESAPKNFSMWGLRSEHDPDPYLLGDYTYLDNEETLQYFPVIHPTSERYNMVELKIISNYGNPNYTCLYRIRVHGNLHPVQL